MTEEDFFRQSLYINVRERIMMEFFLRLNAHHECLELIEEEIPDNVRE